MGFPADPNELLRLKAIAELEVGKRVADPLIDQITAHARSRFRVPICLVTLVEAECVVMLSKQGLDATQAPRNVAFCSHTILGRDVLVVPDLSKDERFKSNPLVIGQPFIRFYAGAPLVYRDEVHLGSLCLMDTKARTLTRGEQAELMMLADTVVSVLVAKALGLPEPDVSLALT